MNILLFVDSQYRDAFGTALTATTLKEMGHRVYVAPFDIHREAVQFLEPDIVVLNHVIGNRNRWIANYVKRHGGKVAVMPTEGRPNTVAQEEWFVTQNDNELFCDLVLSWSQHIADQFQNVLATTVGAPRFGIYDVPYYQLIESPEFFRYRYQLDNRPIITFASSFPQSKFVYKNAEFNRQDWKDLGINRDADEIARSELEKLNWFKTLILSVKNYYGDKFNYIIKPHPMEDISLWRSIANQFGLTLVTNDYIFNVLAASDLLVARGSCLTHQDAWKLGKESVGVVLEDDEIRGATEWAISSMTTVTNSVDLLDTIYDSINSYVTGAEQAELQDEFLVYWGFDEPDSAKLVAKAISALDGRNIHKKDIAAFNVVLQQHDEQNKTPRLDNIGHFGKSCPSSTIKEWEKRIRAIQAPLQER